MKPGRYIKLTVEEEIRIKELYDKDCDELEIATDLRIDIKMVYRVIRRMGLISISKKRKIERGAEIKLLHREGHDRYEIAKFINLSVEQLLPIARRMGISLHLGGNPNSYIKQRVAKKESKIKELYDKEFNDAEIGFILDYNIRKVQMELRQLGLLSSSKRQALEIDNRIVELYDKLNDTELGAVFGLTITDVRKKLAKFSLSIRENERPDCRRVRILMEKVIVLNGNGFNDCKISDKLGIAPSYVNRLRHKADLLSIRGQNQKNKQLLDKGKFKKTKHSGRILAVMEKIKILNNQGFDDVTIANQLKTSSIYVSALRREMKIESIRDKKKKCV